MALDAVARLLTALPWDSITFLHCSLLLSMAVQPCNPIKTLRERVSLNTGLKTHPAAQPLSTEGAKAFLEVLSNDPTARDPCLDPCCDLWIPLPSLVSHVLSPAISADTVPSPGHPFLVLRGEDVPARLLKTSFLRKCFTTSKGRTYLQKKKTTTLLS